MRRVLVGWLAGWLAIEIEIWFFRPAKFFLWLPIYKAETGKPKRAAAAAAAKQHFSFLALAYGAMTPAYFAVIFSAFNLACLPAQ